MQHAAISHRTTQIALKCVTEMTTTYIYSFSLVTFKARFNCLDFSMLNSQQSAFTYYTK